MMGWRHGKAKQQRPATRDASDLTLRASLTKVRSLRFPVALALVLFGVSLAVSPQEKDDRREDARLVPVYHADMVWNGVTTAPDGRVFVDFPPMGQTPGPQVAEIGKDSSLHAYPDASWNRRSPGQDSSHVWLRVNAVRVGPDGNLWVVDCGAPGSGSTAVSGAKIVAFNLSTNQVVRIYEFHSPIVGANSYIDDIRFNGNMAYITDAGVPGLIVMNLDTGAQRRVLDHDRSTTAERPIMAEGQVLKTPDGQLLKIHADQLEVSPDSQYLYFQPASGPLYRIATRWLDDPSLPNAELARQVTRWYDTPSTGGTAIDANGNLYVTDVNQRLILKITPEKKTSVLVSDSRLIWADALWIDDQGNLLIPQAQLNRTAPFNGGISRVQLPYHIFKIQIGAKQFLGIPRK